MVVDMLKFLYLPLFHLDCIVLASLVTRSHADVEIAQSLINLRGSTLPIMVALEALALV